MSGEASSCDTEAALEYPNQLKQVLEKEEYLPQQIFNIDETGLFWKKMPERSYISKEEKSIPGYKAGKERVTLLFGGNASGDFKLKPLLVHRSENPRALKNIPKNSLPVFWQSNNKAWVTMDVFNKWYAENFIPEVENYCKKQKIQFKVLLILDNAPGHPKIIENENPNVKIKFLPPNTTPLLQPMDQGVIAAFKKHYLRETFQQAIKAIDEDETLTLKKFWKDYNICKAIKNIDKAWNETTSKTIRNSWKKLCPHMFDEGENVQTADKEIQEDTSAVAEIVNLANELQLDIEEEDIHQLIESHAEELTNEELFELAAINDESETSSQENSKKFTSSKLAEAFDFMELSLSLFKDQDDDDERFNKVAAGVKDALTCYKIIFDEKRKKTLQNSITQYFDQRNGQNHQ